MRTRLLLLAAVLGTVGLVWLVASLQHGVASTRGERLLDADQLFVATMDEELQLLSTAGSDGTDRLRASLEARGRYEDALDAVRGETEGDDEVLGALGGFTHLHDEWARLVTVAQEHPNDAGAADARADLVEQMRQASTRLHDAIATEQDADQASLTIVLIGICGGLLLLFGGAGTVLAGRKARRDRARRITQERLAAGQAEFGETLQLIGDEAAAHGLVKRHLERAIAGSVVTVLGRNNSANRLEAATEPPAGSKVAERLDAGVEPKACVATRIGRLHERSPGDEPLLRCELCGDEPGATTCTPLLVSGEVIGSVLLATETGLDAQERGRVGESVAQASPVIGNLRNLAIAETRAATDALTGLPNRRSLQDTVRRMLAQASRAVEPLAAVVLDLDHFKQINDRYGHEKGDDVLAAVGQLLSDAIRASDFAARAGGEEFCILLPGTDEVGAETVSEKLRLAISRLDVPGIEEAVTGSFGIAVYPSHAIDAPTLLRKADRALYLAKDHGRDRVEIAAAPRKAEPSEPTERTP
ncbi:MAG TPA: GGDEF domain-containing protein [Solirubrobacteraceae bacterium]|nr:GGDEF domain-containing protein [Solirubrobacteraceae bacterium]